MGSRWGLTESSVNIIVVFFSTFLSLALMSGWCWLLYPMIARKKVRAALWYELNRHGCELCTTCGYDLRGNSSGKCSECGSSVIKPCLKEEDGRFRSVTLPPVSQCFSFMTALLILLWGNVIYLIVFRIKPTSYEGVFKCLFDKVVLLGTRIGAYLRNDPVNTTIPSRSRIRLRWISEVILVRVNCDSGHRYYSRSYNRDSTDLSWDYVLGWAY